MAGAAWARLAAGWVAAVVAAGLAGAVPAGAALGFSFSSSSDSEEELSLSLPLSDSDPDSSSFDFCFCWANFFGSSAHVLCSIVPRREFSWISAPYNASIIPDTVELLPCVCYSARRYSARLSWDKKRSETSLFILFISIICLTKLKYK